MNRKSVFQFMKFVAVGGMNTAVTLVVIFVCKSLLGVNPLISNTIGYVAGMINSFLWNKTWVFRSGGKITAEALRFAVGFGVCYLIQFVFVWGTLKYSPIGQMEWQIAPLAWAGNDWYFTLSGYGVATLIGMAIYTMSNFLYNKFVAFTDVTD